MQPQGADGPQKLVEANCQRDAHRPAIVRRTRGMSRFYLRGMAEVRSPSSQWSWGALWLWGAAVLLLIFAALLALPMVFESSPGERAEAVRHLWPSVLAVALTGVGAAAAGAACLRRVPR